MINLLKSHTTVLLIASSLFCFSSCTESKNDNSETKPDNEVEVKIPQDGNISTLSTPAQFKKVIGKIKTDPNSLFIFDIDNTLLITNDNKFGSDWWYSQSKENKDLILNIDMGCLFDVLTPLFYSTFGTKPVFPTQAEVLDALDQNGNKTIGCTSRGYTPVVASATELELIEHQFDFLDQDSLGLANKVVMLHGVIYTKGKNKGVALVEYLETHPYTNIHYFDDSFFKVEDVQEAFANAGKDISLYYMKIAPKIPYTNDETEYMQNKLCITIESINNVGETDCKCNNPK